MLLVLALTSCLIFVGTAVGVGVSLLTQQQSFHAQLADDPHRLGPTVEITSGGKWALIAWRSEDGICLDFAVPGNSPFACGLPVHGAKAARDSKGAGLPTHQVAGFFSGGNLVGGDGKATIFGIAAAEVASVKVELRNGETLTPALYAAPSELGANVKFFITRVALGQAEHRFESPVSSYNVYDSAGQLLEKAPD
jgi:hypothetical protein